MASKGQPGSGDAVGNSTGYGGSLSISIGLMLAGLCLIVGPGQFNFPGLVSTARAAYTR